MMKKIFIDFHFYGTGNIGDDLMLDGFLQALSTDNEINCLSVGDIKSQKLRFPRVNFESYSLQKRIEYFELSDLIIGVGDTPFQVSCGKWMLNHMNTAVDISGNKHKIYLIAVGAEKEVLKQKAIVKKIIDSCANITTRDSVSADILRTLSNDKIFDGSDLANISLKLLSERIHEQDMRSVDYAICYADESPRFWDLYQIKKFALRENKKKKITFFANDIRDYKNFETGIFNTLFNKNLLKKENNIDLYKPNYTTGSLKELIEHFKNYKTVISSRYHVILTASWMGCKVVALGRRSSKIKSLAKELNIPFVSKPFTQKKIENAIIQATVVERNTLLKNEKIARNSCSYFQEAIE